MRLFFLVLSHLSLYSWSVTADVYSTSETAIINSLGPWPMVSEPDSSNRFSQRADAIELGRQLFFDRRLSKQNLLSCADCHQLGKAFQDSIALNRGLSPLTRNTTSLLNVGHNSWYGWGGEHDSLWSQSIRPLLSEAEMALDVENLRQGLSEDKTFQCAFEKTTDSELNQLSNQDFVVLIGKLLASYQETITTGKSRFDVFREQLYQQSQEKNLLSRVEKTSVLSASEQRGLKTFVGEGRCFFCHSGANFTNGEFADIGVPFFTVNGVDKGRYAGIQGLQKDPYNLLGHFNDDPDKDNAVRTKSVQLLHRNWGEFKVPSLRNIAQTAPYMHNGSLESLEDVVDFYSNLDEERLHVDGERILRPLQLTQFEKQDLVAFLKTLNGPVQYARPNISIFSDCP